MTAQQEADTATSAHERRFDETVRQYNAAFEARDLDRFLRFFRDDAIKIEENGHVSWNRDEIGALFGGLFQMDYTATFPTVHKIVDRHTALLITDITLTFPDFQQHFLTSLTYTEQDGEWKVLTAVSARVPQD